MKKLWNKKGRVMMAAAIAACMMMAGVPGMKSMMMVEAEEVIDENGTQGNGSGEEGQDTGSGFDKGKGGITGGDSGDNGVAPCAEAPISKGGDA